jgi:hypothetical protein
MKLTEKNLVSSQRKNGAQGATILISVDRIRQNYLELKPITDNILVQIIVNLQNESDASSYSSSEKRKEV